MHTHPNPSLTQVQADEEKPIQAPTESQVAKRVEIGENEGKSLAVLAQSIPQVFTFDNWATSKPRNNRILKADLVASW